MKADEQPPDIGSEILAWARDHEYANGAPLQGPRSCVFCGVMMGESHREECPIVRLLAIAEKADEWLEGMADDMQRIANALRGANIQIELD